MLDFVGTVVSVTLMVFVTGAVITFIEMSRSAKLALSAGCRRLDRTVRGVGRRRMDRDVAAVPRHRCVRCNAARGSRACERLARGARRDARSTHAADDRLNVGRVFAVLFLLLAAEGRLAGPFPYFAALGDITTGVVALPMMRRAAAADHRAAITAWNLFGTADLVLAITLGVMSAEGSPLQVFHAAPGSAPCKTCRGRSCRPCWSRSGSSCTRSSSSSFASAPSHRPDHRSPSDGPSDISLAPRRTIVRA